MNLYLMQSPRRVLETLCLVSGLPHGKNFVARLFFVYCWGLPTGRRSCFAFCVRIHRDADWVGSRAL